MDTPDMKQAREHLAEIDRQIAQHHKDTVDRIEVWEGRNVDMRRLRREEWRRFEQAVAPMREQREAIVKAMASVVSLQAPPPILIEQIVTASEKRESGA